MYTATISEINYLRNSGKESSDTIHYHSVFEQWPLNNGEVQSIITSPPYYRLRRYDIPDVVIGGSASL